MRRISLLSVAMVAGVLGACNQTPTPTAMTTDRSVDVLSTGGQTGARAAQSERGPEPAPTIPPGPVSEVPTLSDKVYIDGQVPHHQQLVILADEAIARANSAELKRMARMMKADMLKQIETLKHHRNMWFGSPETPPMHADMIPDIPAGPEFDARWAEVVAFHHQGAIARDQQLLSAPATKELRDMASEDIPKEAAQIEDLEKFYPRVTNEERVKFETFHTEFERRLGLTPTETGTP